MVADEELPDAIAEQVWMRRDLGESYEEIAAWLLRVGYWVRPHEVALIAATYGQRRDEQVRRPPGLARTRERPRVSR